VQAKKISGAEKLHIWLSENKISLYALAQKAKIHYTTMWKLGQGDHFPSLETAVTIEDITGGYISCRSWLLEEELLSKPAGKVKKNRKDKASDNNNTKDKKSTKKLIPK
jgi:hypothetical protein